MENVAPHMATLWPDLPSSIMGPSNTPTAPSPRPTAQSPFLPTSARAMDMPPEVKAYFDYACNEHYQFGLKRLATAHGVSPDDVPELLRQKLRENILQSIRPKAQQHLAHHRLRQHGLLQQRASSLSNTSAVSLSQQQLLPPLLPHAPTVPYKDNGFQVQMASNPSPEDHSVSQKLSPSYQPAAYHSLSAHQTPTPLPLSIVHQHTSPASELQYTLSATVNGEHDVFGEMIQHQDRRKDHLEEGQVAESPAEGVQLPQVQAADHAGKDALLQDGDPNPTAHNIDGVEPPPPQQTRDNSQMGSAGARLMADMQLLSIEQIGNSTNSAHFSVLKNNLARQIQVFNQTYEHHLEQPDYVGYPLMAQRQIEVAAADLLSFVSGLTGLRSSLSKNHRAGQFFYARYAAIALPTVMRQSQEFLRVNLAQIIPFQTRWSVVSKAKVELYHQFSSLKAALMKRDKDTGMGQRSLSRALSVTRIDMWRDLAPSSDEELLEQS